MNTTTYNVSRSAIRTFFSGISLFKVLMTLLFLFTTGVFAQTTDTYTTAGNGTWTAPCGVTSITVEAWGAGGGGQRANGNPSAGGGGSGGGYVRTTYTVVPGTTYNLRVGAGGTGNSGGNGESSWFVNNSTILAVGGRGAGNATNGFGTGATAYTTGNIGGTIVSTYGGNGGNAGNNFSGGGGSSAGNTNGNDANGMTGGTAPANGFAGANGRNNNGAGADGNVGAGGAGGRTAQYTDRFGGAGGRGEIRITYTPVFANYCSPTYTGGVRPITNVTFAGINNTTTNAIGGTESLQSFCDAAEVQRGTSYPISLKANTNNNWQYFFRVYIDWDQNGVFGNNANEIYNIGTITNSNGNAFATALTGTIAVPAGAALGSTRMRVMSRIEEYPNGPCQTGNANDRGYGQAEDYTVNVTSPIPTITTVSPTNACAGSNTPITINGTNFTNVTGVTINGAAVAATDYTVNSSTQIEAILPAGATTGAGTVVVTTATGSANAAFTVNPSPAAIGGGAATVCTGSTTPAFTNAVAGGTWSVTNGTGSASINASGVVTGITAGTAIIQYTLGSCSVTRNITVLGTPGPIGGGTSTICEGESTPAFTNAVAGGTWSVTNGTGSATINASGVVTGTNVGTVTVVYTVGDCTPATRELTINASPIITLSSGTANQTVCINTPITTINYTVGGAATGASVTGLPTGLNGEYISGEFTISGTPTVSGTFNYTVTTSGGSCTDASATGTIIVDALPTITLTSAITTTNQNLCANSSIDTINYTVGGSATGVTVTGLPSGVTGIYNSGAVTISGTPTQSGAFNYTVTTVGGACTAATAMGTIIVNPLPDNAGTITGTAIVCQGQNGVTYSVPVIANATSYVWTLPAGATIVSGDGTNSIVVNYGVTAVSANITVHGQNACGAGVAATLPVTVNITPYIALNYTDAVCSNETVTITPANGGGNTVPVGTSYSWGLPTVTGGMTGATAQTGQSSFVQTLVNTTGTSQTASYQVTATTGGCSASTFSVVITVQPQPVVAATPATQTVCSGEAITPVILSETRGVSGNIDYQWSRTDGNANITGLNSGASSTITGNLVNNSSSVQTAEFTVYAISEYGCQSAPIIVRIHVNPAPTATATPATQIVCSDEPFNINISGAPNNVPGTTFTWTRTDGNTNITGLASGTGNISGSLTNTSAGNQAATFTITASANGCSTTTTVTVTVRPELTLTATPLLQAPVCGGSNITPIVITGTSGATITWTRTDGLANITGLSGTNTGNIVGSLVNLSSGQLTAVFTITATLNGCTKTITATVPVNPTPIVVATPATQAVCDDGTVNIVLSNSNNVPGTTYSWSRIDGNGNITGLASGNTSTISGVLSNNSTTTQTATFQITATAPSGCSSTTIATVTVYAPLAVPVIGYSQDVCGSVFGIGGGEAVPLYMITPVSGGSGNFTYQWQRSANGSTGWTNVGTNNDTFTPNEVGFYRLIITDTNCSPSQSVTSNSDVQIRLTGANIDSPNISGGSATPICNGTVVPPINVSIGHTPLSDVRFYWSVNNSYITPTSGGPVGNTVVTGTIFGIPIWETTSHTFTNTFTANNTTNSTQTSIITITPRFTQGGNSCNSASATRTITIRPTPIAYATGGGNTICNGDTPNIVVNGNITDGNMRFHIQSNNANVTGVPTWVNVNRNPGNNSYTLPALTNTATTTQTVTYTITPYSNYDNNNNNNNDCGGTPITVTVTVAPTPTGGVIAANQAVCYGGDPVAFTQTTAATGAGTLSYQWEMSTVSATGPWTTIAGATSTTYDPGVTTQTTWYRRVVTATLNGAQCTAASNVLVVNINTINAGSINGTQTICSGGTPNTLGNEEAATGLAAPSYQWQISTEGCGSGWANITGATDATYAPGNITETTYFRRVATSTSGGSSCSDVSNCVVVTVNDVTGGTIGYDQVICGNNPDNIEEVSISTGSGTLTYQWQLSTNLVSWATISGATNATYNPPAGVTQTTYYKRITYSTLNGVSCSAESSNYVTVTPSGVTAGVIEGNRTVCDGGNPAAFTEVTAATGTNLSYQWQLSTVSGAGPWTDITGATDAVYDEPGPVYQTTYYRRVVTSTIGSVECSAETSFVTVFVNDVTASIVSGNQTVCNTDDPVAFTVTTPAIGSGTLSYQWQSSIDNGATWNNINLATGATYNPPVLAQTTWYQVIVTSTMNGVSCSEISNILTVDVSTFVNATASITSPAPVDCNDTTIQLQANGSGQWTAVSMPSGHGFSFSDVNNPNATFTGESGVTYNITWTLDNPSPCADSQAVVNVTFPTCGNFIDFDGNNDYVSFNNNFNLSGNFSFELWIKPEVVNGTTKTIISKRHATDMSTGYDLSYVNNTVSFNWNSAGQIAVGGINADRWYHIAVTYSGGTYNLYVDGVLRNTVAGTIPATNTASFLMGAMSRPLQTPVNYYNGWMDELRVWNTALNVNQIREMMNQEIQNNSGNVRGSVIPLDISGLNWSNLTAYYQMNQVTQLSGGMLVATSGGVNGSLRNITTNQAESAPLPYVSAQAGNWDIATTWLNGNVQQLPNTGGIDWNIVRTLHDVTSGNRATTLLGLLVDSNRYSITNDQRLDVTKYLRINGTLDLVGESQLLQPDNSYVDYNGTGRLEIDQQGTGNKFNYNYWGSPVNNAGTTGVLNTSANRTFALGNILYDGNNSNTAVAWASGHSAATTTPLTLSSYWLYLFNNATGNYNNWISINQNTAVQAGFGYTMKGAGNIGSNQNYTFKGQPNTGTITRLVNAGNEILLGNPYPSAIDANAFISANIGALEDGAIRYWVQSPSNNSHVLAQYEGGYAKYNLIGGVPAVTPPSEIAGIGGAGAFIPQRYMPVGQGFFVSANAVGGNVIFNNNQRVFQKESNGNSIFLRSANAAESDSNTEEDLIQRIRLDVKSPANSVRHLLLGFTPDNAATDAFDYGYDAKNADNFPNDVAFMIDNDKYVIQGVGAFDDSKQYPLGIFLSNTGTVEISLAAIENFDTPVDVFIYDALLGTYTPINDLSFQVQLEAGNYTNRYYVVFQEDETLNIIDNDLKDIKVAFLHATKEIYVKTPYHIQAKQVYLINIAGQTVKSWNATNTTLSNEFKIPVRGISEGNYIVQIETNSGSYSKKIIVKY